MLMLPNLIIAGVPYAPPDRELGGLPASSGCTALSAWLTG